MTFNHLDNREKIIHVIENKKWTYKINSDSIDIAITECSDYISTYPYICGHIRIISLANKTTYIKMSGSMHLETAAAIEIIIVSSGLILGIFSLYKAFPWWLLALVTFFIFANLIKYELNRNKQMNAIIKTIEAELL